MTTTLDTVPLNETQSLSMTEGGEQTEEYLSFFDFNQAKLRIDNLIQQWIQEVNYTLTRRKMRSIDVDITQLHKEGLLKADETFIPIRVIDSTIRREQPSYVAFLTQSRRLAIFSSVDDPSYDTNVLEGEFTRGMMYSGWQQPLYKCLDGAQTHGWDSVEVEYRQDRPLHCNIDHIGHENLLFAKDSRDIEACEIVLRRYELTIAQIKRFVKKFGWDPDQAKNIYAKVDQTKDFKNIVVYKYTFKWEGIVYVAWYSNVECSAWIKAPAPLSLGRQKSEEYTDIENRQQVIPHPSGANVIINVPIPVKKSRQVSDYETSYPYKILLYAETEQQSITEYKGRCFLDGPKQEAQTALWSILVNGSVRAGNVYGSPKNADNSGAPIKKLDTTLEHGCIYSQPMDFWHTDYPDPNIVKASDSLETKSQVESGQIAFAVSNRQDSRKTATENNIAQQQQSMLSSVGVTLFSVFLQKVFSHSWLVIQSQAMQGLIPFLVTEQQTNNPLGMVEMIRVNNYEVIGKQYDIRSAGDVDVVQRSEKLNRRMTLWPIISATPLATTFLSDIIKEAFPEDADRYTQVLEQLAQQQQQGQQQMMAMGNIIHHMATDDGGNVKPEFAKYVPQLQQLKQQLTQQPQQQAA